MAELKVPGLSGREPQRPEQSKSTYVPEYTGGSFDGFDTASDLILDMVRSAPELAKEGGYFAADYYPSTNSVQGGGNSADRHFDAGTFGYTPYSSWALDNLAKELGYEDLILEEGLDVSDQNSQDSRNKGRLMDIVSRMSREQEKLSPAQKALVSDIQPYLETITGMAKGGEVKPMEQQMNLFEEGGLADDGMTREPVTGNEIPTGSMAEEVRDDIDAKLSPGEYVVPADVVRFFGVKFFEDLRSKAKSDMMAMERDGRVGGEPVSNDGIPMDDELTPEEEAMLAEAMAADKGYATGGYVPTSPYNMGGSPYGMGGQGGGFESRQYVNTQTGETRTFQFLNGQPISMIPAGFVPATPEALAAAQAATATPETATEGTGVATGQTPSGTDSSIQVTTTGSTSGGTNALTNYGPEDVQNYVNIQNPLQAGTDLLEGGSMGKMIGGGLGLLVGGVGGLRAGAQIGEGLGSASNIAKAAANAEVADILGYDTAELNNNINNRMEELGMISGSVAAGLVDKARADARQGFYSVNAADAQTRDLFQSEEAFNAAMEEVAPEGTTYNADTGSYTSTETGSGTAARLGGTLKETTDSGVNVYTPTASTPRPTARPSDLGGSSSPGSSDSGSSGGGLYKAVTGKAFKDTKLGKFLSGNSDD